MEAANIGGASGPFVICRSAPSQTWSYWTGRGIARRRQRWSHDVRRACRFYLEVNGWKTAVRLKDRDAIVFRADAVGEW